MIGFNGFGLPEIVLLFAVLQTLLLTAVLLGAPGRLSAFNRFLCAFLLALALVLVEAVLVKAGVIWQYPHILGVSLPAYFILAPLYYLYVRTMLGHELRRADALHALPLFAGMLLAAPSFFSPAERKLEVLAQLTGDGFTQFPLLAVVLLSLISFQTIAYFYSAYDSLESYESLASEQSASLSLVAVGWLKKLSVAFCLFVVIFYLAAAELFFFYQYRLGLFSPGLFSFGIAGFIFWVSWHVYRHAELFALYTPGALPITRKEEPAAAPGKYRKTQLSTEELEQYATRLQDLMVRERPYLDGDLRLAQLAERLDIPAHHLSQVINVTRQQTFFDFINQQRIDRARELLQERDIGASILEIALESGFNTKASFNRVFKKSTGLTPSAYQKQQKHAAIGEYLTR